MISHFVSAVLALGGCSVIELLISTTISRITGRVSSSNCLPAQAWGVMSMDGSKGTRPGRLAPALPPAAGSPPVPGPAGCRYTAGRRALSDAGATAAATGAVHRDNQAAAGYRRRRQEHQAKKLPHVAGFPGEQRSTPPGRPMRLGGPSRALGAWKQGWGLVGKRLERKRINRPELRAVFCQRGALRALDPNARPIGT